jgi:hypothetical protein
MGCCPNGARRMLRRIRGYGRRWNPILQPSKSSGGREPYRAPKTSKVAATINTECQLNLLPFHWWGIYISCSPGPVEMTMGQSERPFSLAGSPLKFWTCADVRCGDGRRTFCAFWSEFCSGRAETLGARGESGSGKSTLGAVLLRYSTRARKPKRELSGLTGMI